MVIPWVGFPLADVLKRVEPTRRAKYVEFPTLLDPEQMPGTAPAVPRLAVRRGPAHRRGDAPADDPRGGTLRRGRCRTRTARRSGWSCRGSTASRASSPSSRSAFVQTQPPTTWNEAAPNEYGFYANVNPTVDHPRWSQATERRIGELFRRDTLPFNGYGDEVAGLYAGMDLTSGFWDGDAGRRRAGAPPPPPLCGCQAGEGGGGGKRR